MSFLAIRKLCESELVNGTDGSASWHYAYSDSAYIYIGGLEPELTEGDIVIAFSQFGEIVDVNLARDPETGISKGFCFLAYAYQKSTILAIDNMNGCPLYKRLLKVDHVKNYRVKGDMAYQGTGAEGSGLGVKLLSDEPSINLKVENLKIDEDEEWAKEFDRKIKQEKYS